MVAIHPRRIVGNWRSGIALDVHTVRSTHLGVNEFGHDVFDTERSELGELLHRLKYRGATGAPLKASSRPPSVTLCLIARSST